MKKNFVLTILFFFSFFYFKTYSAEFDIKAKTVILQDHLSGKILFEKEADLIALEYLENAGLNKNNFSLAIEKLTRYVCSSNLTQSIQDCLENNENSWLSTHPSGAARLKYLSEH